MRQLRTLIVMTLLLSPVAGCGLLYELQPHRLKKLNSGPAPSFDPEFTTLDSATAIDLAHRSKTGSQPVVRAQSPR